MNKVEIIESINEGVKIHDLVTKQIEDKLLEIMDALDFMGLDFKFFENDEILTKISSEIKRKFGYLTDRELTIIISMGCQGEFKRTAQIIKGYHLFSWIGEYLEIRQKALADHRDTFDDDEKVDKVDLNKYPLGQAIIWKMDHVKTEDWEKIPMKKVAEIIKNKGNLRTLASDCGIELIK